MVFLRAYQAYCQRNYDQCLKLLQEIKQNDIRKLDLQAQVYFQKKEFQNAYNTYQILLEKDPSGEFREERQENIRTIIACAQLEQPNVPLKTKEPVPTTNDIVEQVELISLKDPDVYDLLANQEATKKKNKTKRSQKKRKIRLPKIYDPVAGPDPERWLPRRDRKSNAHRQKRRRQRPKGGKSRVK